MDVQLNSSCALPERQVERRQSILGSFPARSPVRNVQRRPDQSLTRLTLAPSLSWKHLPLYPHTVSRRKEFICFWAS